MAGEEAKNHNFLRKMSVRRSKTTFLEKWGQKRPVESSGQCAGRLSKAADVIKGCFRLYQAQPKSQEEQTLLRAIQGYEQITLPVIRGISGKTSQHGLADWVKQKFHFGAIRIGDIRHLSHALGYQSIT